MSKDFDITTNIGQAHSNLMRLTARVLGIGEMARSLSKVDIRVTDWVPGVYGGLYMEGVIFSVVLPKDGQEELYEFAFYNDLDAVVRWNILPDEPTSEHNGYETLYVLNFLQYLILESRVKFSTPQHQEKHLQKMNKIARFRDKAYRQWQKQLMKEPVQA